MYRGCAPTRANNAPLKHFSQLWLFYCILIITEIHQYGTRTLISYFSLLRIAERDLGGRKAPLPSSVLALPSGRGGPRRMLPRSSHRATGRRNSGTDNP